MLAELAAELDVAEDVLAALVEVESGTAPPVLGDGYPLIRFEVHHVRRNARRVDGTLAAGVPSEVVGPLRYVGRLADGGWALRHDAVDDPADPTDGTHTAHAARIGGTWERAHLASGRHGLDVSQARERAVRGVAIAALLVAGFAVDAADEVASRCASFGRWQVLGSNYRAAGYGSAAAMLDAWRDPVEQDAGWLRFVTADRDLVAALRDEDFDRVAAIYNGPANVRKYGPKLRAAVAARRGGDR